jgi:hypothetical protein
MTEHARCSSVERQSSTGPTCGAERRSGAIPTRGGKRTVREHAT